MRIPLRGQVRVRGHAGFRRASSWNLRLAQMEDEMSLAYTRRIRFMQPFHVRVLLSILDAARWIRAIPQRLLDGIGEKP